MGFVGNIADLPSTVMMRIPGMLAGMLVCAFFGACGTRVPSPDPPPGAEPHAWARALGVLRAAATGAPGYDAATSARAVSQLGLFDDVETLGRIARAENLEHAAWALEALALRSAEFVDPAPAVRAAASRSADVRLAAADAVGALLATHPTLVPVMIRLAADPEARVRAGAVAASARSARGPGGEKAREVARALVAAALTDDAVPVRLAAVVSWGTVRDPDGDELDARVAALLPDAPAAFRRTLIPALARVGVAVPEIRALLTAADPEVRAGASVALASIRRESEAAVSVLIALLTDDDVAVRGVALEALHGRPAPVAARELLADAIAVGLAGADRRHTLQAGAILLVLRVPGHRAAALAALRRVVSGHDPLALSAARYLAQEGEVDGERALVMAASSHRDAALRAAAVTLVARIRDDRVLPLLMDALEDADGGVRVAAASAALRVLRRP